MKNFIICCLLIFQALTGAFAQSLRQQADKLLRAYQQRGQFDGSVLIARGDQIIYQGQFGWANRQFKVPITSTTRFPIASVTKLYAATLILSLQQDGKLHIDSPVARYLPNLLPQSGRLITIRQLLNHESGLASDKVPDYTTRRLPFEFIRTRVSDSLLFTPGTKYRYNNVNHILLACIIGQVTGQPWEQLLQQLITRPLQLRHTGMVQRDSVVDELAYGYHNYAFGNVTVKDPLKNDYPLYLENYALAGAIYTTPAELFIFHQALQRRHILAPPAYALLYGIDSLRSKKDDRGYWVTPGGYVGTEQIGGSTVRIIERNGNINGYNATYLQLPDQQLTLIVLCNTDAGDLEAIAKQLLALVVPGIS